MITFKIKKIFMDMILKGLKLIELRKLDEKIIILINNFLAEKKSQKVIFEVIETGEKYKVEITNFEIVSIGKFGVWSTLQSSFGDYCDEDSISWHFAWYEKWLWIPRLTKTVKFEEGFDTDYFSEELDVEFSEDYNYEEKTITYEYIDPEFKNWLNEYYKNESHIVIYDIGKVGKI